MEENKKCCEGKECEHKEGCCGMNKCCMWKKCHGMKHLIWIVLIIVAFCLGTQLGELKSEARGGREFRGGMMNWRFDQSGLQQKGVGSVTVDVSKTPTIPAVTQ